MSLKTISRTVDFIINVYDLQHAFDEIEVYCKQWKC